MTFIQRKLPAKALFISDNGQLKDFCMERMVGERTFYKRQLTAKTFYQRELKAKRFFIRDN